MRAVGREVPHRVFIGIAWYVVVIAPIVREI